MKMQAILQLLDVMLEDLYSEQLMYKSNIKAKLDRDEVAIARGEVVSQVGVVKRSEQWLP